MTIDELDRRILNELQSNNRLTMEALADRVGSTPPTCLRRIKRLRDLGAITADVSLIDPRVAGKGMTMIVEVTVERERRDLIDQFKLDVMKNPKIAQCYYVTGEADFVLLVHVGDMEEYEDFVSSFFHGNPNIKQFKTLISIRRVKYATKIPL